MSSNTQKQHTEGRDCGGNSEIVMDSNHCERTIEIANEIYWEVTHQGPAYPILKWVTNLWAAGIDKNSNDQEWSPKPGISPAFKNGPKETEVYVNTFRDEMKSIVKDINMKQVDFLKVPCWRDRHNVDINNLTEY